MKGELKGEHFCNSCQCGVTAITQDGRPGMEKHGNDGAAVRCGVCGSSDVVTAAEFTQMASHGAGLEKL